MIESVHGIDLTSAHCYMIIRNSNEYCDEIGHFASNGDHNEER